MFLVNTNHTLTQINWQSYRNDVKAINTMINDASGPGGDFLGWRDYPKTYDKKEFAKIKRWANYVRTNFEVLVVAGIGGSYLGARAAIEAINGLRNNDSIEIIFMGQTLSPNYIYQTLEYLKNKKFAVNVISKSGTTTETSISFRLLKQMLEEKLGKEEASKAIFATTDAKNGLLRELANKEKYVTFNLPANIGGRFSVLTAVGLFPLACAGIDISKLMEGAYDAMKEYDNGDIMTNQCYQYAVIRDHFYRTGKKVEMFVTYEPQFRELGEWLKQLFGESEGKEELGLLPDSAVFSTDLHSLGQFIQEGSKILFETIIYPRIPNNDVEIPKDDEDLDGLNYIAGKKLSFVNEKAFLGTLEAHTADGKVPNIIIEMDEMNAYNLGHLFYFFMRACAMSAYLLHINPFNQPGVEIYKKNMFHLLGKKGY